MKKKNCLRTLDTTVCLFYVFEKYCGFYKLMLSMVSLLVYIHVDKFRDFLFEFALSLIQCVINIIVFIINR